MDRFDFKRAMMAGLGRAYLALQTGARENFRDIVQWGCLHLMTINSQSDGLPDEYVFRLVTSFEDPEAFLAPLVNAYRAFSWEDDSELFAYYTRLLGHFAAAGYDDANDVLERYLLGFCMEMGAPGYQPKYEINYEEEMLGEVALALILADPKCYVPKIAFELGALLFEREGTHFDLLYSNLEAQPNRDILRPLADCHEAEVSAFLINLYRLYEHRTTYDEKILPFLRTPAGDRPAAGAGESTIKASVLAPLRERLLEADPDVFEPVDDEDDDEGESPYGFPTDDDDDESPYGLPTDDEEDAVDDEAQTDEERELMRAVKIGSERKKKRYDEVLMDETLLRTENGFRELLTCINYYDKGISENAKEIFASLHHPKAIRYALDRLYVKGAEWWTVEILLRNYSPEYRPLILTALRRMPLTFEDDDLEWLSVVYSIMWLSDATQRRLPSDIFRYVYESSLCRRTRFDAMRILHERGDLTEEEQNECYFDASPRIRHYAETHHFVKKG